MRIINKKGRKEKKMNIVGIVVILIILMGLCGNHNVKVTKITYSSSNIPSSFTGYKIVQISDLHNNEFGENQKRLIHKVKQEEPDAIVITGDLIDSSTINMNVALTFVKGIKDIAPIYFIMGNHETWSNRYGNLKKELQALDVVVLENESCIIEKEGRQIELIGITDPWYKVKYQKGEKEEDIISYMLDKLTKDTKNQFTILLAHRPEYINTYAKYPVDLVVSGHAHGGQFRIPYIGGLYAPGQGIFPKYTSGLHKVDNTSIIISRGLGNSSFPVRLFNPPELVVITLKSEEQQK